MREKLRELRTSKKMTQSNIAEKLCIGRSHYSKIENGHKGITLDNALKLKEVLDYKEDDLFKNN